MHVATKLVKMARLSLSKISSEALVADILICSGESGAIQGDSGSLIAATGHLRSLVSRGMPHVAGKPSSDRCEFDWCLTGSEGTYRDRVASCSGDRAASAYKTASLRIGADKSELQADGASDVSVVVHMLNVVSQARRRQTRYEDLPGNRGINVR